MNSQMKNRLKSDSGYSLGLVLIFVLAVGTVLGSVMMVTQLSADAQGRGVDQLRAANNIAASTAEVVQTLTEATAAGDVLTSTTDHPNCGFPMEDHEVTITCTLVPSSDSKSYQQVRLHMKSRNGRVVERLYTVTSIPTDPMDPKSEHVEHVTGFND